ncbi:hypothetical protein RKLH11_661 [Rhodobacteraceae bacterium KLH11]|nr:hypothetical protein RKLH11_661 [Rhodobacteraceae bacterium KLH11]
MRYGAFTCLPQHSQDRQAADRVLQHQFAGCHAFLNGSYAKK